MRNASGSIIGTEPEVADDLLRDDRFDENPPEFVGIATPRLIYIGVKDRGEFDKIDRPCVDSGLKPTGHVLVKTVHGDGVNIIFQHWLKSETFVARRSRLSVERATRTAGTAGKVSDDDIVEMTSREAALGPEGTSS